MSQIYEERPLCTSCGREVEPLEHFCPHCNAPCDGLAVTGPYETILSRGWSYRSAQRPQNFLVVIGAWMVWGPLLFGAIAMLAIGLSELVGTVRNGRWPPMGERMAICLVGVIASAVTYVAATNLYRTTSYYLRQSATEPADDSDADIDDDVDPDPDGDLADGSPPA